LKQKDEMTQASEEIKPLHCPICGAQLYKTEMVWVCSECGLRMPIKKKAIMEKRNDKLNLEECKELIKWAFMAKGAKEERRSHGK